MDGKSVEEVSGAHPGKVGHDPDGWTISDGNAIREDTVFKARYTLKKYNVEFFDTDGTTRIGSLQRVDYGKSANVPLESAITKDPGYVFAGWHISPDSSGTDYKAVNGDMKIYATQAWETNYKFYARLKETATHYASPASDALNVRTDKLPSDKEDQDAPPAPKLASKTTSSVTLKVIAGAEYSKDGINWQPSATFTGLRANTVYKFYARMKATATHNASPASVALTVKLISQKSALAKPTGLKLTEKKAKWKKVAYNHGPSREMPADLFQDKCKTCMGNF